MRLESRIELHQAAIDANIHNLILGNRTSGIFNLGPDLLGHIPDVEFSDVLLDRLGRGRHGGLLDASAVQHDGCDGDGGEAGSALADCVGDDLEGLRVLETWGVDLQDLLDLETQRLQPLAFVCLGDGQDAGIDRVLYIEGRVRGDVRGGAAVLGVEIDEEVVVLVHVQNSEAEELTEEHARDALLKHLDPGIDGGLVESDVVLGGRQNLELVVEGTPFSVDDHLSCGFVVVALQRFLDVGQFLNIGAVGSSTENGTKKGSGLARGCVRTRHESANSIIDQS